MKYDEAILLIDEANKKDTNQEIVGDITYSKEYIYGVRMSKKLEDFMPDAPESLKLAVRCQHICRWEIPRSTYPMDKVGYITWRNELKKMHSQKAEEILKEVGYEQDLIDEVKFMLLKKQLKKNELTQALEDVICLVFLEFYFDDFATKHSDEKIIDIVQKTWGKMSDKGHEAALKLPFSDSGLALVQKALA
ncbi:DUF4202 domain-containing protein [Wenyingzhuangia sp. 2_MG-2023]|uniref:DUF4202 domain-containing protein n=1 Tax=Wenyingzhuangia sp. 2_MG-2023 TaxID=3062639 RepID=UPI0026E236FB|nr:DUF4202 domain-containing protein [Wenyingzhuangia sp. 2_MG-2023]MDO6736418.1 DUF4202 domain-containing protein [Wenyingzhuangia sp. 2_MG-2023]